MTAQQFALQVAAIGGQQVWHAAWLTLMWAVLLAALVTVLWGIVHPGRWLRRRNRITHIVFLPPALPAALSCPCCTATPFTVNDCTCREPCGELWCQANDPDTETGTDLADWVPGEHRG